MNAVRSSRLADPVREIERQTEVVDALAQRARQCVAGRLARAEDDIAHTRARLRALPRRDAGPWLRDRAAGHSSVVRSAAAVSAGEQLSVRFAEDQLSVTVDDE